MKINEAMFLKLLNNIQEQKKQAKTLLQLNEFEAMESFLMDLYNQVSAANKKGGVQALIEFKEQVTKSNELTLF